MTVGRLILIVLEVADIERSLGFYRDLLGIPLRPDLDHGGGDRWISCDHAALSWTEGAFLHFALYKTKGVITRDIQIGFPCDDVDAMHDKLTRAKVHVDHGPRDEPWGRTARYRDPDGNSVSLTQR